MNVNRLEQIRQMAEQLKNHPTLLKDFKNLVNTVSKKNLKDPETVQFKLLNEMVKMDCLGDDKKTYGFIREHQNLMKRIPPLFDLKKALRRA